MNRRQAKKWLPEIEFWGNGGKVYFYDNALWKNCENLINFIKTCHDKALLAIEDKHFEARKAFALDEPIEVWLNNQWVVDKAPSWFNDGKYRPKKKEWYDEVSEDNPILCWVWDDSRDKGIRASPIIKHQPDDLFPFIESYDDAGAWKHAEPVKVEDLYHEQK